MSLIQIQLIRFAKALGVGLVFMATAVAALAQTISTTTVQGTVYLANGSPGSGTLQLSWPAFTTASNQTVTAGRITTNISADGFVSVNLAPNLGSSPAGLFYTAIYHMSDGTTSTEYWVVPGAAQASIAQVRSQVMPAAQAVQAVSKAYVDQAVQSVAQGNLTSTGGQLTGPLYLTGDPTQSLQAADKHYVDASFAQAVPLSGGVVNGSLTAQQLGAAYQVDQFPGADFGAKLHACLSTISSVYGGTCDARNFSGNLAMAANLTISTANTTVMLPCATISTASQIIVAAGTRNVSLRGCALRGSSNASGSQGGSALLYSGPAAAIQVGDRTYAADTNGFHLDNVVINTTAATSASAQAIAAYRTQEMDLESLYLLGNANQTGVTLDGTGNYTGGTFYDNHILGFQTAINGIGHQVTNPAATDWLNASTFVRLHIDCPTASGNPMSGTYGINLQQGDGNSFTGGDVENCATAVHLGANAQNNTIVGLRNENSTNQVVADAGSSYNSWITGGTMFTGKLTDNGTRNSFLDAFHRSFNSLNGDWYGSQQDATLTNHLRLGIGSGNERGLLDRYQTDYGYRWTMGLSDATGGEQFYQVLDELNNVYRLSIGQYNNGQASTNNQTVINSAGTGAVVLNGSNNAGTGGVVFGSGGANESTVATVSNSGNAQFNGTLQVGGTTQSAGTMTVRNNADAEVDYYLWPGLSTGQKGSFTYKDWNGNSQWYLVKDASNNWALNSATGGLDSFKAYQSTNSGDTYINASNASGVVRVNYESGAGTTFNIYGGNSSNLYASFSGNASIKFPGLSASSGHNCLQIDASGYITNTGAACSSGSGTVNSGSTGQIAYYNNNGTTVSGMSTIPVVAGGTGASTAAGALAALGGVSLAATTAQNLAGPLNASVNSQINVMAYGAKGDCSTDDHNAITSALRAADTYASGTTLPATIVFPKPPGGCYLTSTLTWYGESLQGQPTGFGDLVTTKYPVVIRGKPGQDVIAAPDPSQSASIFPWWHSWTIKDLTFQVDGSSAGNFPHRWPGKWFDDTTTTTGSPVISTVAGELSCGDIGQAIQINGAGAGGTPLVTTIASVSPCWAVSGATTWQVVTLAANAQATLTNAHTYVSLLGLPVTANIGNCAIALPMLDAKVSDWPTSQDEGNNNDEISNVTFSGFGSGVGSSTACGMFTQGNTTPYQLTARNVNFYFIPFGVVQSTAEQNSTQAASGNDFQIWDHVWMFGPKYPWISYNGGGNTLSNWQLSTGSGPQILQVGNIPGDCACGWNIGTGGFEIVGTNTGYGERIEGSSHYLNYPAVAGPGTTAQINANQSTGTIGSTGGSIVVGASNLTAVISGQGVSTSVTDNGRGNKLTSIYNGTGWLGGQQNNYYQTMIPYKGESQVSGRITADNLRDGNYATQYNWDDLLIWPQDWIAFPTPGFNTPYSAFYVADAASPSGAELVLNNNNQPNQFGQFSRNNGKITVGSNIPASKVIVSYMAKCSAATGSFTLNIKTSTNAVPASDTEPCSTALQTFHFVVDLSSFSGQSLGIIANTSTNIYLAWLAFTPYQSVNGIPVGGSGAQIVTGPATSTLHNCPWFTDTVGTIGDSGSGCSAGGGLSGQTANYIPKATSATGSTTSSHMNDGGTLANQIAVVGEGVAVLPNSTTLTNPAGAMSIINSLGNSGGTAEMDLVEGNLNARAGLILRYYNAGAPTEYWRFGIGGNAGTSDLTLKDSTGSKVVLDFPNNTMPNNSIGGNANGATAITQSASDNTNNIATDAFVHAQFGKSTLTVPTTTVAANSCNTGTAVTIPGITSTSSLQWPTPNGDPSAITGFGASASRLYFVIWPTANTYNWKICNNSASSITPGASTTWNIGAIF